MKKTFLFFLALQFLFEVKTQVFSDTISLGGNFNIDIYYSLRDSSITSNPSANNWSIAFATIPTAPSIIINGGKGVKLWEVPANIMDTSSFNQTLDTSNLQQWNNLRDSDTSWYRSAFQQNDSNEPPYGWGVFNHSNFEINGDKLFLLKTQNNNFYKIWILDKILGTYRIKYATINHSFDTIQNIEASNFIQRNFIFLDLDSRILNNREPLHTNWDLLFSEYQKLNGDIVVGVKSNSLQKSFNSSEYKGVEIALSNELPENASYQNLTFSNKINTIGNNWYELENGNVELQDSLTYFIKRNNGDIFKFWFTSFDGNASGTITFQYEKVFTGTTHINSTFSNQISVYPNPNSGKINFEFKKEFPSKLALQVFDLNGKLVHQINEFNPLNSLDISFLSNGIYYLHLFDDNLTFNQKIILSK